MLVDILTVGFTGLLVGVFFSMPIAGPISIIITSNALKGKLLFCQRTALGAAIVETVYVLIAVYGIATLYAYYKPVIPYVLVIGSIFIFSIAIKIIRTKLRVDKMSPETLSFDKVRNRGGFRTGMLLNLTNPTLFIGWLVSSFMVFSFLASIGLQTGGLEQALNNNIEAVSKIAGDEFKKPELPDKPVKVQPSENSKSSLILLSVIYAFTVGLGGFLWFYFYSKFIVAHREKLNLHFLNRLIQILGIFLAGLALYLFYQGLKLL